MIDVETTRNITEDIPEDTVRIDLQWLKYVPNEMHQYVMDTRLKEYDSPRNLTLVIPLDVYNAYNKDR